MTTFIDALQAGPVLTDGAMGSYIFDRTGRLSRPGFLYEAQNLDNPEIVREIHLAYLRVGARCLTTNTFGANGQTLAESGEGERLADINRNAVRLARFAIETHERVAAGDGPYFILGSLGPVEEGPHGPDGIAETYGEQIRVLVGEGVDALLLETFTSVDKLAALVAFVGDELSEAPPIIAQMALGQNARPSSWDGDPHGLIAAAAAAGAAVVGVNCCAPWDAESFVEAAAGHPLVRSGQVFLSAIPNGGGYQRIGNRYMTRVNPEFMGQTARNLIDRGVRLLGGCCEVHPNHIREMGNYLRSRESPKVVVVPPSRPLLASAGAAEKEGNGPLSRKIKRGEYAVSVEILPSRGTAADVLDRKIAFVERLAASGRVDALDITDGSRGIPLMPPGEFIAVIRSRLGWTAERGDGLELIPHFTTRDINIMGLQSRLVGYHARRIHCVIFITGDPPKMSPTYPQSTAVFDTDSVGMIRLTHENLNSGVDFGGRPLARRGEPRTHFTIASGFEPESVNKARELERLDHKIDAGVDCILTQPVFRPEAMSVLEPYRHRVPILAGVMLLKGLDHAFRVNNVPGVVIPDGILNRLGRYETPADQAREAVAIAVEQSRRVRKEGWAGLYLMSPAAEEPLLTILPEV